MPDRYTTPDDVFQPERVGEVIVDTVYEQLALLNTPAVTELGGNFSNGGNTVTFPIFKGVQGDFSDLDCTDSTGANDPDIVYSDMDFETVDVVSKIIDVGIKGCTLDDAYRAENFDIVDATLGDVAAKAQKLVDRYLITTANGTSLTHTVASSGIMSRSVVIKQKAALWGDMAAMPSVFVCHSKVYGDILDEVKDYNILGPNNTTMGASLPYFLGMPVVVSDACPVNSSNYTSFVLGAGALGFSFHRNMSYKVLPQRGDRNIHEFVVRYIASLRRKNGKDLALAITSK